MLDTNRFEIRQLTAEHIDWAKAIVIHSNIFHSPLWPVVYPENKTARALKAFAGADYLVKHQIDSGLSYGVFDKQYVYKNPESVATNGKLYWDPKDLTADGPKLLEQMDFPLASVALSYDSINALDMSQMGSLIEALPLFAVVYHELTVRDKRDPSTWKATEAGQVLFRNATSTRAEYEGHGLMKTQARWLMKTAAEMGFRGIQIECAHNAVNHVWSKPPAPFKGEIISELQPKTYEQVNEETGEKSHPFGTAVQRLTKVYVTLK